MYVTERVNNVFTIHTYIWIHLQKFGKVMSLQQVMPYAMSLHVSTLIELIAHIIPARHKHT